MQRYAITIAVLGWLVQNAFGGAAPVHPGSKGPASTKLTTTPAKLPRISPQPVAVGGATAPSLDLGGEWRFSPAPPAGFATNPAALPGTNWAPIQVPGQWLQQGFTVVPKTEAAYFRRVTIPSNWAGHRIKLRCDGLYSLATVYVGGREVGKHQGVFTPFEFDITDNVKPGGETSIGLSIRSASDADECAQGIRYACHDLGGITRKIQLVAVPLLNAASLHVGTTFTPPGFEKAVLKVDLTVANDGPSPSSASAITLELRSPQGQLLARATVPVPAIPAGGTTPVSRSLPVDHPSLWDVEHPRLHTLTTTLGQGQQAETFSTRVGFRQVELRDKKFLVNGREAKLRGICRHETDPLRGRSLQAGAWRKDVELLARANCNFIRTSHYPPAAEFFEACDEFGMLVQCEAPFCWAHPRVPESVVVAETLAMVQFNRNHPSIVMWSLGNESQFGAAFVAAAKSMRQADSSRPIMFSYSEKAQDYIDFVFHHYPEPAAIPRVASGTKPVLFDEYAHLSDSNRRELLSDPGVRDAWGWKLANLWELMRAQSGSLGGAVWSAVDDIYFLPGGRVAGYGVWGCLDAWRRPKPEYWHLAKVYSPVRILNERVDAPAAGQPIRLTVENRSDFADLREMRFAWTLAGASGQAAAEAAPGQKTTLQIVPQRATAGQTLEIHITGPRGFEVDAYRFILGEGPAALPAPLRQPGSLTLTQTPRELTVAGTEFAYVLDASTGQLKSGKTSGAALPLTGPSLTIVPMNADNGGDRRLAGKEPEVTSLWGLCTGWTASTVSARQSGASVVVKVAGAYTEATGSYQLTFDSAGRLTVGWSFSSSAEIDLRQVGITFTLPKACDTLSWRRRGQWNYYPADHIARLQGSARASSGRPFCGLFVGPRQPPAWPWSEDWNQYGCNDFRSTKFNIIEAVLSDGHSLGLRAVAAADRHAHAWLDGEQAFLAILDYANDGVNEGLLKGHRGVPPRVIARGGIITGSAQFELAAPPR